MPSYYFVAVLAVFTSFASMAYELVIAQSLAILSDEVIWWESISIGIFIAATGVGVFLFDSITKKNLLNFFMKAECLLALTGLLALPFILFLHIFYRIYILDNTPHGAFLKPLNWVMFACQTPNAFIGLLSGFELRVLFDLLASDDSKRNTRSQVFVLVIYHLGALIASLVFAAFVHWKMDSFQLAFSASILNAFVCLWCLRRNVLESPSHLFSKISGMALIGILSVFYISSQFAWKTIRELQVKNFYYNTISASIEKGVFRQTGPVRLGELVSWAAKMPSIKRKISSYQVIDLVPDIENAKDWSLFLDGHFQFSSTTERFYHETLAHVPIMLSEEVPKNVLVLGGGDGLLSRELLKYKDRIHRIDLIEIDKDMIEFGKALPFSLLNANSLSHPRLHVSIADAFIWLRLSQAQFDAIYIDFPYPYTFEGLRIYSAEFLSLAARHLRSNGFVVMDIPIFGAGDPHWQAHVSSLLARSGFQKVVAFEGGYGETFLLALKKERALTFAFRDLGIPLETLNRDWFASENNRLELTHAMTSDVNSILKPKRISLPDVWK